MTRKRNDCLFQSLVVSCYALWAMLNVSMFAQRAAAQNVSASTDPSPSSDCVSNACIVYSAQQLHDALAGTSQCAGCAGAIPGHIIIPAEVAIHLNSTIQLGDLHNGLRLTINGTLVWTGSADCQQSIIIVSGSGITVDGSGLLTSIYVPCQRMPSELKPECFFDICNPASCWDSNAKPFIAYGISVEGATHLKVSGLSSEAPLRFANLSSIVQANGGGIDVTLRHLDGTELAGYGVFGAGQRWTLDDCHVHGGENGFTCYNDIGFRFYVDGLMMRDCSAHHVRSGKLGFWHVGGIHTQGENFLIDGFVSGQPCWLGSVPAQRSASQIADEAEHAVCISGIVRNVRFAAGGSGSQPKEVVFHKGWDPHKQVHVVGDIAGPTGGGVIWPYGDPDGVVNVDDLLAVINSWGSCPPASKYFCRADVSPDFGDGEVDVNDLLVVINHWGPCQSGTGGAPESVEDCQQRCAVRYPNTSSQDYSKCVGDCIEALCRAGILSPQECGEP